MTEPGLQYRILDKALEMGEAGQWEDVRLHAVADALDISLDEVRMHYAQKDDLVEAWFDRADQAALRGHRYHEAVEADAAQRLQQVIMAWLDALAAHRRLTREMLAYKLEPGHLHLQVLGVLRVSRTVQWFREAARLDARGVQRIFEEIALTGIYLATFARWLLDDSPDARSTREFLRQALRPWQSRHARHHDTPEASGPGTGTGDSAPRSPGSSVSMH